MSNITALTLIVVYIYVQTFSADGQSTLGSCEANALNSADEMQSQILNEIRYFQNRDHVCNSRCSQSEDRLERQLSNITQALERLDQNVQNGFSASTRQDGRGFIPWPRDCDDLRKVGQNVSDVYQISVPGPAIISVYCDMNASRAGWLVFQRRKDGSENFERTWVEYKNGFGNRTGEFWLGNDALHLLTSNRNYKLRIELEDFEGDQRYAEYEQFYVGPAFNNYTLNISGYSGNAGDSMEFHNGQMFSTMDVDNDHRFRFSCAQTYHGAWWYNTCHDANLNGLYLRGNHSTYANGINWEQFRGRYYSLKIVEMKITPRN